MNLRLVYVVQHFSTPSQGGSTRAYEFIRRLTRNGWHVTVITGRSIPSPAMDEIPDGAQVVSTATPYMKEFGPLRRIRSFAEFALKAIVMGWSIRPNLIFASSTPLTVGLPALVLSWRHRVPFVFEVRDLWPEAPIQMKVIRNPMVIRLLRWFEKLVYARAAKNVALSPGMLEGIMKAGVSSSKTALIPNTSQLDVFQPGPIDMSYLSKKGIPRRPTIAYAGSLGDANAVDLIGQAAVLLHQMGVNVQIVVAGTGKHFAYLERLVQSHQLTTLVLLGRIPKQEVVDLYKASVAGLVTFSDVPILETNSPNKFFDLLAAGRPVITNMGGWISGLVRDNQIGFVVDKRDPRKMADAIVAASENPRFEEMAQNARALAEREFATDKLAAKFEQVLREAVDGFRAIEGKNPADHTIS